MAEKLKFALVTVYKINMILVISRAQEILCKIYDNVQAYKVQLFPDL